MKFGGGFGGATFPNGGTWVCGGLYTSRLSAESIRCWAENACPVKFDVLVGTGGGITVAGIGGRGLFGPLLKPPLAIGNEENPSAC